MSQETHASSSTNTSNQKYIDTTEDNLEMHIRNDKVEAELLENEDIQNIEKVEADQDDERVGTIRFRCFSCEMEEMVHYFGIEPNFAFGVLFNEPTYVMRDPFHPPPPKWKFRPEYFVALGAHCKLCDNAVCKDSACSFFYLNTYCINCVKKLAYTFPDDIQQKLRKQLSALTNN